MRILFVTEKRINAGSIQAVASYITAADKLGHTIAMYGCPDPSFPKIRFSTDAGQFDFVMFILESKLEWLSGLRVARILSSVPFERRSVLDADGLYNDLISVEGYDRNHANRSERDHWREACDQLGSRIFQPTLAPLDSRVEPLLFYGYTEREVQPRAPKFKSIDLMNVCHNWWRWKELEESLFPALECHRDQLGEICFVGLWWDACPLWAASLGLQEAFRVDAQRLKELRIRVRPPVAFTDVVSVMSSAKVNLMTQRPLFQRLGIVTSKYFEILCADTIPLVLLEPTLAESVYGPAGRDIAVRGRVERSLLDSLHCPEHFSGAVQRVREHSRIHHSYRTRVEQLVAALEA